MSFIRLSFSVSGFKTFLSFLFSFLSVFSFSVCLSSFLCFLKSNHDGSCFGCGYRSAFLFFLFFSSVRYFQNFFPQEKKTKQKRKRKWKSNLCLSKSNLHRIIRERGEQPRFKTANIVFAVNGFFSPQKE